MSNALTTRSGAAFAMVPQSVQEALEFARLMANSGMVPDIYAGQAGRVLAAMQLGAEVGLPPMTALQRIFIQNGKPTMDTRGCLAIVEASGYLIAKSETWDAVTKTATVMVQRKGRDPIVRTFSEEDAKRVHCKENQQSITLDQKGTYRIAQASSGFNASWKEGAETKRWRGTLEEYAAQGIDKKRLTAWCREHGWETILNRAGMSFRKLSDEEKADLNQTKAITLMMANPSMIKRPVLDLGSHRVVGFKPDNYAKELGK